MNKEKAYLKALLNTFFGLIDSPKKRLALVDDYINNLPRKFSEKEKQILKEKLLKLPLNLW
jgi:hypothetical protein